MRRLVVVVALLLAVGLAEAAPVGEGDALQPPVQVVDVKSFPEPPLKDLAPAPSTTMTYLEKKQKEKPAAPPAAPAPVEEAKPEESPQTDPVPDTVRETPPTQTEKTAEASKEAASSEGKTAVGSPGALSAAPGSTLLVAAALSLLLF